MTFHSVSIFYCGWVLSLYSTSHLATQARTLSLTVPFWTTSKNLSRYVLIEKIYQASWSISIDLDAQYVSSFTEVFLWKKLLSNTPLCFPENSTSFPIDTMSFTYTYQKCYSAPTHFLVNTGFTASLYKTISFDQLIKAYIPTPRGSRQSINGLLELAHFVSTFWIDKTFLLYHILFFFKISVKECSFDIHLPDFIKCGNC